MPGELLEVGRAIKPHGLTGEVVVHLTTNRLERLEIGAELVARAPGRDDRTLEVLSARPHQHRFLVRFATVVDRDGAEALRAALLFAPAIAEGELYVHELIGATVVDRDGTERGTVTAVEANPASDLLVIDGSVLCPLAFVVAEEPGRIVVDAPLGIFPLMITVRILTIFPELVETYLDASILGRAREAALIDLGVADLRDGADDARRSVDDAPFGGGAGMVLSPGPIAAAIERLALPRPIYLLTPSGRRFDQSVARELAAGDGFSLLCGRYEGVDERVATECCDGELSIGDFVLAGGELAALAITEAVCRLVPGVLGNRDSPGEESFDDDLLEYPQYTRPQVFRDLEVPAVLVSGDHGRIADWRRASALWRTATRRPDLLERRGGLTVGEVELLAAHGYPVPAATPVQVTPSAPRASGRVVEEPK